MEYIKEYSLELYNYIVYLHEQKQKKKNKWFNKIYKKFKNNKPTVCPSEENINKILNSALAFMQIDKDEYNKINYANLHSEDSEKYRNQDIANAFWMYNIDKNWLCLNLLVQTDWYKPIYSQIMNYSKIKNIKSVYDYGCGSASLSLMLNNVLHFNNLVLTDLDNYASKFIKHYINEQNTNNIIWKNILDEDNSNKYDMVICLDVLEHLENSYSHLIKLDKKLKKGGVLALKIAFECEDKTHLPRAAEDFFIKNNGLKFLEDNYKQTCEFYGSQLIDGIYIKK